MSAQTFDIMLAVAARHGNEYDMNEVLESMSSHNFEQTIFTLNTRLNNACKQGDINRPLEILQEMISSNISPDDASFNVLARMCSQSNGNEMQKKIIATIEESTSENKGLLKEALFARLGNHEFAEKLLSTRGGISSGDVTPYMVVSAMMACRDTSAVVALLEKAIGANKADAAVLSAAAKRCSGLGEPMKGLKIIDVMVKLGIPFNKFSQYLQASYSYS